MNYAYDEWQDWVRRIWYRKSPYVDHENPFDVICEAFKRSEHDVLLERYRKPLNQIKDLTKKEIIKCSINFKPIFDHGDVLSFWM